MRQRQAREPAADGQQAGGPKRSRGAAKSRARLRGLPPDAIAEDQRQRIIEGVGEAIAEHGYRRTVVEHVIQRAGVSRRTFYEFFANKDDAFCAAHAEALDVLEERLESACQSETDWARKVGAAVAAAVEWAVADPHRAQLIAAEPFGAGPHMAHCHERLAARFAPALKRGRRACAVEPPPSLEEALLAGMTGIVAARLRSGEDSALPDLAPEITELFLTPYLGAAGAKWVVYG